MHTAEKQGRDTRARYKLPFNARLRRTTDSVLPGKFVNVETTLANQPHKLAPVTNGLFLIVAVDPLTVSIQLLDNTVEKIFCSRVCCKNNEHTSLSYLRATASSSQSFPYFGFIRSSSSSHFCFLQF